MTPDELAKAEQYLEFVTLDIDLEYAGPRQILAADWSVVSRLLAITRNSRPA